MAMSKNFMFYGFNLISSLMNFFKSNRELVSKKSYLCVSGGLND